MSSSVRHVPQVEVPATIVSPTARGRSLSRRRLLTSLAFSPLAALAGCGTQGGGGSVVRFWNGFTGPDGRTMLALVRRFNEANPDVYVIMQRMDWATYYNKLFVAGLGGRAPELFVIHSRAMDRFARAGFCRANDDLVSGPEGLDISDINANVWEAVSYKEKHYGLPLDVFPMGMYYNRRLFQEAGLDPDKPPRTRDEFMEAIRKMKKGDQWGFVFTNLETCAYTVLQQFGGRIFTSDFSQCVLNNPENVAALSFYRSLIEQGLVPSPENFDAWIGFRQGRVGMVFEGIYMLADLQKQKDLDFGGAPVPLFGSQPAVWADSHNLCMRADLKERDLEATWRFMKFLSDNSVDWAAGGQVPTRKSLRATRRFQAMPVQSAFATQLDNVRYLPRLPFIFEYQTEFGRSVERILRGRATPEVALGEAEAKINSIIARERANGVIA